MGADYLQKRFGKTNLRAFIYGITFYFLIQSDENDLVSLLSKIILPTGRPELFLTTKIQSAPL